MAKPTVAISGGGVAGTSVAHELAERGFRFFPGFYRHVTDTMKRIPYSGNRQDVFDNLVMTTRMLPGRGGPKPMVGLVNFLKSAADLRVLLDELLTSDTGLSDSGKEVFGARVWQLPSSSYERRQQTYERVAWWHYRLAPDWWDVPRYIYLAEALLMLPVPALLLRALGRGGRWVPLAGLLEGAAMLLACLIAFTLAG